MKPAFKHKQLQCGEQETKTILPETKTRSPSLRFLGSTLPRVASADLEEERTEQSFGGITSNPVTLCLPSGAM